MATSPEFTGRVKVPVAEASGIRQVDEQTAKLEREDAARRAAAAAKVAQVQPKPNTDIYR